MGRLSARAEGGEEDLSHKGDMLGPITRRDEHLVLVPFSKTAVTNQSEREASHRSQSRARSGKAFAYYCNDLSARVLISQILTKIGSVAFTGTGIEIAASHH